MAASDLINFSLDEIIARGGKFRQNRRGRSGGVRRGGSFRRGAGRIPVIGGRVSKIGQPKLRNFGSNKLCTVNISNLSTMVTTTDLQELFEGHQFLDVSVQYDLAGESTGTAIVIFKRFEDAMRLKRQYSGLKLDGKMMDLYVLSGDEVTRKMSAGRVNRNRFGGRRVRQNGNRPNRGRGIDSERKQMSNDELDRELDEYMRGSKHPKIVAP